MSSTCATRKGRAPRARPSLTTLFGKIDKNVRVYQLVSLLHQGWGKGRATRQQEFHCDIPEELRKKLQDKKIPIKLHCMTKNATMEVDGHEIQTPHCIQSSRFSSALQFCIIWQVIESSD